MTGVPSRVRVRCDACGASAVLGPRPDGRCDAWCEACQAGAVVDAASGACAHCGGAMASSSPAFPALYDELHRLAAVLAAWTGDAHPLCRLLPERSEYLSDLSPPARREGDEPRLIQLLDALAQGEWRRVRLAVLEQPGPDADPRVHAAAAIAHERLGDHAAAEAAWSEALARGESPRAHLARGALRARRGAWALAEADLRLAGDAREARWNRAAVILHRAIESAPGLPPPEVLEQARREAGQPAEHPASPTIGRLLWTLVLERILSRNAAERAAMASPSRAGEDERVLRIAEQAFEHDTFPDRALVLAGYALAGLPRDAARVALPLADGLAARWQGERALAAATLRPLAGALALVRVEIAAAAPGRARAHLAPALEHDVLRRGRVPCVHCLAGGVGVEPLRED